MNRWIFAFRRMSRQLWWRASLYAALGRPSRPWPEPGARRSLRRSWPSGFGGDSVEAVLTILASSLLAVATFSLGAMVTAYTSVSSAATPRAAALITGGRKHPEGPGHLCRGLSLRHRRGDGDQCAVLRAGRPGDHLPVSAWSWWPWSPFRLLTWVSRLTRLARLSHTVERVEGRDPDRLGRRGEAAAHGRIGRRAGPRADHRGAPDRLCAERGHPAAAGGGPSGPRGRIQVIARPGAFVMRGEPLARLSQDAIDADAVQTAFTLGRERSFDQDPRYGLIVLGEVADKALSAAVNDIGTVVGGDRFGGAASGSVGRRGAGGSAALRPRAGRALVGARSAGRHLRPRGPSRRPRPDQRGQAAQGAGLPVGPPGPGASDLGHGRAADAGRGLRQCRRRRAAAALRRPGPDKRGLDEIPRAVRLGLAQTPSSRHAAPLRHSLLASS